MIPDYIEEIPSGAMWSMRIRRGRRLRLTAMENDTNVSALAYHVHHLLDRLNVPDTLKALHTAKLHRGHVLMSDMGHSLLSIVDDTLGWHDPLGGAIDADLVAAKFGIQTYQSAHNGFHRNARDNFLVELGKYGLGEKDIVANVNFFSKVMVDDSGKMHLVSPGESARQSVTLRADMDVLVVLANCPHPMHPGGDYPGGAVRVELLAGDPAPPDDFCRNFRPECERAHALSDRFQL